MPKSIPQRDNTRRYRHVLIMGPDPSTGCEEFSFYSWLYHQILPQAANERDMHIRLPKTILITGARAPVALHWARLLVQAGHVVWLADTLNAPLASASRLISGYIQFPSPHFSPDAFAIELERHCTRLGIGMILPTCEEIFHLAKLVECGQISTPLFAPSFESLARAHNKYQFIQTCAAIGLATPRTRLIQTKSDLGDITLNDHVFKPVWSRFGNKVLVRPNASDLKIITPSAEQPWLAQEFLEGEEISVFAIAIKGKLRAISAYRAGARAGKGASIVFEPMSEPFIDTAVSAYIEATNWHGQISFDLKRDASGQLRPIECNPRATSGLHFFIDGSALLNAFAKTCTHRPEISTRVGSKLALLVYGNPVRHPKRFANLWHTTKDIHAWPDDDISYWKQINALREILAVSFRERISPQAASTFDIEWNGPKAR